MGARHLQTTATMAPSVSHVISRKMLASRLTLFMILLATFSTTYQFANAMKFNAYVMPKEDPYVVLGIKKKDRNNMDAIKKSYREKAKAAHPDKNPGLDPSVANKNFHRINEAWEFLSNKQFKKRYDSRKSSGTNWQKPQSQQKSHAQRQREREEAKRRQEQEKRRQEQKAEEARIRRQVLERAKEAQDNMLKISSLEQLIEADVIDKATYRFKKHFLCVFVSNKNIERVAEKDYLFPYPFGRNGRKDFDWRPILQTAKVRYNKDTPLTKAFNVPKALSAPYIVFAAKGARFNTREFTAITSSLGKGNAYENLEKWVLSKLDTKVTIVNRYPEDGPSIRAYFDMTTSWKNVRLRSAGPTIPPGHQLDLPAQISDRIIILDSTTNDFVGSSGILNEKELHLDKDTVDRIALDDVFVVAEKQTIDMGTGFGTTRSCYDTSTHCQNWISGRVNKCKTHSTFTHAVCPKSCGVCIDSPMFNGVYYTILHMPQHKFPRVLGPVISSLREAKSFTSVFGHDFVHIWSVRRNVTAAFFVSGILVGIQAILLARLIMKGLNNNLRVDVVARQQGQTTSNSPSVVVMGFLIALTGAVISMGLWLTQTHEQKVPWFLQSFRIDLLVMQKTSSDIVVHLLCLGIASYMVSKVLISRLQSRLNLRVLYYALFVVSTVILSTIMVNGTTIYFINNKGSAEGAYRLRRWDSILKIRKNVAASVIGVGHLFGATVVTFMYFVKHNSRWRFRRESSLYIFGILLNIGFGCGLLSLALQDKYFLDDLEHVTSMRMSAAIPCLICGLVLGLSGANLCTSIIVTRQNRKRKKLKMD